MLFAVQLVILAAAPSPEQVLERAETALRKVDYREATAGFEAACAQAACTRLEQLRVYVGLATIQASLAQATRAIETYKALLFVAPGWELPAGASPRLNDPLEHARQYWKSRRPPRVSLKVTAPTQTQRGEAAATLETDPLSMVSRLTVQVAASDQKLELEPIAGSRVSSAEGGFTERYALPEGEGPWVITAEARAASGSVLLEAEPVEVARPIPPPPPAVVLPEPEVQPEPRALLHATAGAMFEPLERRIGVEVRAVISPLSVLDVSVGALFGRIIGLRAAVQGHLPHRFRVSPFVQARLAMQLLTQGPMFGGGAGAGMHVELWRGRAWLMAAFEAYAAPSSVTPRAFLLMAGYEFDLPLPETRLP